MLPMVKERVKRSDRQEGVEDTNSDSDKDIRFGDQTRCAWRENVR